MLIAILEKVSLKRENYLTLMQHVKVFVEDRQTQKKGYKILARVIERFELTSLDDIVEIKQTITPIMKGQANKDRIVLINSFINAVKQVCEKNESSVEAGDSRMAQAVELLRSFVIEIIAAIRNSN